MSFLTNYYSSINQSPPKFAQISNDIQNNSNSFFVYNLDSCNQEDAMWGNGNKPVPQNCQSKYMLNNGNSCHTIWNNSTKRKLIVKDY